MKNILLVNPWICDFAAYDLWVFPYGLLNISGCFQDRGLRFKLLNFLERSDLALTNNRQDHSLTAAYGTGYFPKTQVSTPKPVSFMDRRFYRYGRSLPELRQELKGFSPDLILMTSGMTYWHVGITESISALKSEFPGIPVVLGGTYATLCPEHAQKHSGADIVFHGKDMKLIAELINKILKTEITPSDPGAMSPDFSLLSKQEVLPILASQGCPLRCSYCASFKLYPRFLQYDFARVADLIEHCCRQCHTKDFVFYDDALLYDPENFIKPLLRRVIRQGSSVRFHTPNGLHARFIDSELAELMFRSGFKTLRLSFESSADFLQKKSSRKITNDQLTGAIKMLYAAGFTKTEIGVYTLLGFPGQRVTDIEADIQFVHENKAQVLLSSYSLVPQSREWEDFIQREIIPRDIDPLLLSHSVFPVKFGGFRSEELRFLRRKASELNRR